MVTKKLMLYFPQCETEKPIVYHLVKDYNLIINIFRAKVTPEEEGYMILDVTGEEKDIKKGIEFVKTFQIDIHENQIGLRWNKEKCAQCGVCIPHCPTDALSIPNKKTMQITFTNEKCIECLSCIKNCPYGACTSIF